MASSDDVTMREKAPAIYVLSFCFLFLHVLVCEFNLGYVAILFFVINLNLAF